MSSGDSGKWDRFRWHLTLLLKWASSLHQPQMSSAATFLDGIIHILWASGFCSPGINHQKGWYYKPPFSEWSLKCISTANYFQREEKEDCLTASSGTCWGGELKPRRAWVSLDLTLIWAVRRCCITYWQIWPTAYFCVSSLQHVCGCFHP